MGKNNECWPWSHQWSKWVDIAKVDEKSHSSGKIVNTGVIQERRCEKCGKAQQHIVWAK